MFSAFAQSQQYGNPLIKKTLAESSNGINGRIKKEFLFQDSAGTTPVTSDGDPVGLVVDDSGYGNDFYQDVSADRPIYHTDGTIEWIESNGTNQYFKFDNAAWLGTTTPKTIVACYEGTGSGSYHFTVSTRFDDGTINNNSKGWIYITGGSFDSFWAYTDSQNLGSDHFSYQANTKYTISVISEENAGDVTFRINNANESTVVSDNTSNDATDGTAVLLRQKNAFSGTKLYNICIFDHVVDDTTLQRISKYLANQAGLTI